MMNDLSLRVGIRKTVAARRMGLCLLVLGGLSRAALATPEETLAYGIGPNPAVYSFNYSGTAILVLVDSDVVKTWLPPQLELGRCEVSASSARHPVLMVLGAQSNFARHTWMTYRPSFGRYYQESFIIVPHLRFSDSADDRPVSYYARLYLNDPRGTELGRRLFGWPKSFAAIDSSDAAYEIRTAEDQPLIRVRFDEASRKPLAANTSFATIEKMLAQPTVLVHQGAYHLVSMRFVIQTEALRSVDARLEISRGFMPNLSAGVFRSKGLADDALGTVQFSARVVESRLD